MNSETGGISRQPVKGKTDDINVFQKKFEGSRLRHPSSDWASGRSSKAKIQPEPGYMQKVRAKAHRTGYTVRRTASALVLPTGKKIEALTDGKPREYRTYKVRRGVLTVTNQDGETVMRSNAKELERYNGLTLRGETNDKGEIELKRGMGDRRRLKEGNRYLTPREDREIKKNRAVEEQIKAKSRRQKNKKRAKKAAEIAQKAGAKIKQAGLSLGRGLGRF